MPRGRPRKVKEEPKEEKYKVYVEVDENALQVEEKKAEEKVVESKPAPVIEPLGPGQQYFEAPDGRILIGSADMTRLWDRVGNMWVNPKR